MPNLRRGRPLKFGRAARVVGVTLPTDTIDALREIDKDLGRAIESLVGLVRTPRGAAARPLVDFEKVGRRRSLIVVDRQAFSRIPGCDLVPISDHRALLALAAGKRLEDLELAVIDRLADARLPASEREPLEALRVTLRECRLAPEIAVEPRSILVVGRTRGRGDASPD